MNTASSEVNGSEVRAWSLEAKKFKGSQWPLCPGNPVTIFFSDSEDCEIGVRLDAFSARSLLNHLKNMEAKGYI